MELIGQAFVSGRIDFLPEANPWAFARLNEGLKQSQKDRIVVDPSQARISLHSAPVNEKETPDWMTELEGILRSADRVILQYKSGVLRFRRATHDAGKNRQFVTLGNQDEFDLYGQEHWKRIRYLYALRRPAAYCFDISTMITHRANSPLNTRRIEMVARLDLTDPSGTPMVSFDSTGHSASADIVEWRGTVKEGETGRYAPEDAHIDFRVTQIHRPFSFLHEDRVEFNNHSYTFSGEKMHGLFRRIIKKKLIDMDKAEKAAAEQSKIESEKTES